MNEKIISFWVLLLISFQLFAQTIVSDGLSFKLQPNTYALSQSAELYINRQNSNPTDIRKQSHSNDESGQFIEKFANFSIYKEDVSRSISHGIQSKQTTQTNQKNQLIKQLKKPVVLSERTNQLAVVNSILLKYQTLDQLETIINANSDIELLNIIKPLRLAVIVPKTNSNVSLVDLFLRLQGYSQQPIEHGIERLSLDVLDKEFTPN